MKASVALCTYNGEKYLANQLDSILNQTIAINEIIICDDRSTDKTIDIVEEYNQRFEGIIKIYINENNLGGKLNFEKAFSLTTGDIIFFSDQDDTWQPNKVEVTLRAFVQNPKCLGIFSDGNLVDANGQMLGCSFWDSLTLDITERNNLKKEDICHHILNYVNIVAGAMLAVKKDCKNFLLPFKFMEKMWHDQYIALVLSSMNKLSFVDSKLINYRQHSEQQIGAGTEEFKRKVSSLKMLKILEYQQKYPMLYFNHSWDTYEKVQYLEKEFTSFKALVPYYKNRAMHARMNLLNHQPFIMRKARLCKWYLAGNFETSLKDVVVL